MLDGLSQRVPSWQERSPAAETVAVVEVLAYVADYLSYFQDAVGTEAYLSTARRRVSLARHAQLLDYRVSQGCNARTWVQIEVDPTTPSGRHIVLPAGTQLLSEVSGAPSRIGSVEQYDDAMKQQPVVFETMEDVELLPGRTEGLRLDAESVGLVLPRGATSMMLLPHQPCVQPGEVLLIASPDGDPWRRHVVRVAAVERLSVQGAERVRVRWRDDDALPFDLALAGFVDVDGGCAAVSGNMVLADHGRTLPGPPPALGGPTHVVDLPAVPADLPYRPSLPFRGVAFAVPYDGRAAARKSAQEALQQDPREALAQVTLVQRQTPPLAPIRWALRPDLFESGPFALDFVVEMEEGGAGSLLFGDGTSGWRPGQQASFCLRQRVGNGEAGNVGPDFLRHVVTTEEHVTGVLKSLAATGGQEPESQHSIRTHAPVAYRSQERCVTPEDYVTQAKRFGARDAAASFASMGSWDTAMVYARGSDDWSLSSAEREALSAYLGDRTLAGIDLELHPPAPLPVDVRLRVEVSSTSIRTAIEEQLQQLFRSGGAGSDAGFFAPSRWTFGQPLYLSSIIARAIEVPGVVEVTAERFCPWGEPPHGELAAGVIRPAWNEIVRADSDREHPRHGSVSFDVRGGR